MATKKTTSPVTAFLASLQRNPDYSPSDMTERAAAFEALEKGYVRMHGNKFTLKELGRYQLEELEGKAEGLTMIRALKPTRNRIKAQQAEANVGAKERLGLEHVLEQMSELYTPELYRQMRGVSRELRTPVAALSEALARYLNPNNLTGARRDRVLREMFGQT